MDTLFPFGFPWATAFYLTLYVLTFALHQFFMHFVLVGSLVVAIATFWGGQSDKNSTDHPLLAAVRDWLPFMLSAAITAGVAPLLFIQIVYPYHFYTANLLLGWRWMMVIPALILAFYLLYVIKVKYTGRGARVVNPAAAVVAAACFLFVGFCWSANHLISNAPERWANVYASGISLSALPVVLRMLVWVGGACGSFAVIAGWQMASHPGFAKNEERKQTTARVLAILSAAGLLVAVLAGVGYLFVADNALWDAVFSPLALPYTIVAMVGVVAQVVCWWFLQSRSGPLSPVWLASATLACVVTLVAVSVVRESIRLTTVDIAQLETVHRQATSIGGFYVFILFAVLNTVVIAACVWMVRRQLKAN